MPFNNETQDNLLQQMACDVAGKTRVMKQQMSATALDAKDLQNISACSVLLQLGLVIVYKSSLFLEPGMDVKNQMFVQLKVHGQVFCSTAQGFSVEEVYNIFYQVDEILLLRCFQSKEWVMQTRS